MDSVAVGSHNVWEDVEVTEKPRSRVGQSHRVCPVCGRKTNRCAPDCARVVERDASAALMTQSEVARALGMSRARVQQIEVGALRKLRFRLAGLR